MKKISFHSVVLAFAAASLLSSCAFLQKGEFAQRKYYDFPRARHSVEGKQTENAAAPNEKTPKDRVTAKAENNSAPAPVVVASVNKTKAAAPAARKKITPYEAKKAAISPSNLIQEKPADHPVRKSYAAKRMEEKALSHRSSDAGVMLVLMVLAAIFIPPLACFLKDNGRTSKWFWITLLLCLIAVIGFTLIFALGGVCWFVAVIIALLNVFDLL